MPKKNNFMHKSNDHYPSLSPRHTLNILNLKPSELGLGLFVSIA
jgi:hypothetical protein